MAGFNKEQEDGSATEDDIWDRGGQPRIFPGPFGQDGPRGNPSGTRGCGRESDRAGTRRVEVWRSGDLCRVSALRRVIQETRRRDRRHHRHAAQLRRRARHCGRDSLVGPEGAGAGAGHAGPLRQHDHRDAPRQLLRQDERVQQHDAVRHQVLAHHAAHRNRAIAGVQGRPGMVLRGLPHRQGPEEPAHRRDWRASYGIQHGALLRADFRNQRHHHRDARSF